MTIEKVVSEGRAKTYHYAKNGLTFCGKSSIFMRRVAFGQRGDGLPPCLKCTAKKVKSK